MVMETLEMEVARINMTGRHSSLDKLPHSSQHQRSYLLCCAKLFLSLLRCCNPNLHWCRESISADVILLQLSAQSPSFHSAFDWPSHCTVNTLLMVPRQHGTLKNSKVLYTFTGRFNALQSYVQGCQTLHNFDNHLHNFALLSQSLTLLFVFQSTGWLVHFHLHLRHHLNHHLCGWLGRCWLVHYSDRQRQVGRTWPDSAILEMIIMITIIILMITIMILMMTRIIIIITIILTLNVN